MNSCQTLYLTQLIKELGKMLKLISTKKNLKSHLISKLIRKADLNLLNRSKTGFFSRGRGKSIESPLDRLHLHAYTQEVFGLLLVFCKLMSIFTEVLNS